MQVFFGDDMLQGLAGDGSQGNRSVIERVSPGSFFEDGGHVGLFPGLGIHGEGYCG